MRIGQLAERTGMTVRTLRYYEEIGLVGPASRTPAGQRVYGPDDVERLYQVAFLRSFGLPLDDVRTSLRCDPSELRALMADHMASLDAQQLLRSRLAHLVDQLDSPEDTTGALLTVLEDMNMTQPTLDRRLSILVCVDVDAHHQHAVERGANIRYSPVDQPYGYREHSAVDLEGHLWSFMKALG